MDTDNEAGNTIPNERAPLLRPETNFPRSTWRKFFEPQAMLPRTLLPQFMTLKTGRQNTARCSFFKIEELFLKTLLEIKDTYSLLNASEVNHAFRRRIITGTNALQQRLISRKGIVIHRVLRLGSGIPIFDRCKSQDSFSAAIYRPPQPGLRDGLVTLNLVLDLKWYDLEKLTDQSRPLESPQSSADRIQLCFEDLFARTQYHRQAWRETRDILRGRCDFRTSCGGGAGGGYAVLDVAEMV